MAVSRADEDGYQRLEAEWQAVSQALARKLQAITDTQSLSAQQQLLSDAQQDAQSASAAIETIESEMRHFPYTLAKRAQKAVEQHTAELERHKSMLRRYETSINAGRPAGVSHMDLVNRLDDNTRTRYMDQREQLLSGAQIVSESDDSLTRTQRVLNETAEIGAATSEQLVKQREQFQGQLHNLHETDDFLNRSKRTLQRMRRRLVTNKLLQGAIILVQAGIIGVIIYVKYYD